MQQDTFCSYCGTRFASEAYPKQCAACGQITFLNAPTVGVGVVPMNGGLLVAQRAIPPFIGQWAFSGGFKELHETWEDGITREIYEETGIVTKVIREIAVRNASNGTVLVFGLCERVDRLGFPSHPNAEVADLRIATAPETLAFPTHTEIMQRYFAGEF